MEKIKKYLKSAKFDKDLFDIATGAGIAGAVFIVYLIVRTWL